MGKLGLQKWQTKETIILVEVSESVEIINSGPFKKMKNSKLYVILHQIRQRNNSFLN